MAGDVDRDHCVKLEDFGHLSSGINRCSGDPDYRVDLDFNGDGCVDAVDFFLLEPNINTCLGP
jgi:hypothetical protein